MVAEKVTGLASFGNSEISFHRAGERFRFPFTHMRMCEAVTKLRRGNKTELRVKNGSAAQFSRSAVKEVDGARYRAGPGEGRFSPPYLPSHVRSASENGRDKRWDNAVYIAWRLFMKLIAIAILAITAVSGAPQAKRNAPAGAARASHRQTPGDRLVELLNAAVEEINRFKEFTADPLDVGTLVRAALWDVKSRADPLERRTLHTGVKGYEPSPVENNSIAKQNALLQLLTIPKNDDARSNWGLYITDIIDQYHDVCHPRDGERAPDTCIANPRNPFAKLENLSPETKSVLLVSLTDGIKVLPAQNSE